MGAKEWEVLAVSQGKGGQYYMELCDGDGVRREPIEPRYASILLMTMAQGKHIYASEIPKEGEHGPDGLPG